MAEKNQISWMEYMQNPKGLALKKHIAKLLEQKYLVYEETINRATHQLITEKDLTLFGNMLSDIYELGYMKAVNDYKDQLAKLNIKVNISQKNLDGNQ